MTSRTELMRMIQEAADAASAPPACEEEDEASAPAGTATLAAPAEQPESRVQEVGVGTVEHIRAPGKEPPSPAATAAASPREVVIFVRCGMINLRVTLIQKFLDKPFSAAVLTPFLGAYNRKASTTLRPTDLLAVRIDGKLIAPSSFETPAGSLLPKDKHFLDLTPPKAAAGAAIESRSADQPTSKLGMDLIALCSDPTSTPQQLMAAAKACSPDDLRCKDERDKTPLHLLSMHDDHPELVSLFIKRGADIDAKDHEHCTPLMVAVLYGRVATARMLLQNGADSTIQALDGDTPYEVARAWGQAEDSEMAALFTAHSSTAAR